jgi:PHO85 cyclin-6/7
MLIITNFPQVGGLPLVELNHLELQFLILNDFRLSIPVEELEAYGTMLVEFYAREIVAQQQAAQQHLSQQATSTSGDEIYMQQLRNPSAR